MTVSHQIMTILHHMVVRGVPSYIVRMMLRLMTNINIIINNNKL